MQSIDSARERAAAGQRAALARQQEFMALAPGVGIIPTEFRNKGYDKLDFGPGEGGIAGLLESRSANSNDALSKGDFLAGMRELVGALKGADQAQADAIGAVTAEVKRSNDTIEKIDGRRRRQGVQ